MGESASNNLYAGSYTQFKDIPSLISISTPTLWTRVVPENFARAMTPKAKLHHLRHGAAGLMGLDAS